MSVGSQLDRLVPLDEDAFGDWDDVLARAGVRRRRPLVAAGVVVTLLLVALFVSPAFGILTKLIGRIDVPFAGKPAAPTRVQRDFFSMSVAAPPGMSPQAIASQTRRVGVLDGHALYVAPTRAGGYCWQLERSGGGCRAHRTAQGGPIGVSWLMGQHRGGPLYVQGVSGDLTLAGTHSLWLEYADGTKQQIPFIWVSKPIDAGFFGFRISTAHETPPTRAVALLARGADGKALDRETFGYTRPPRPPHVVAPHRPHPPQPYPAPTPPFQQGSAPGITVVVGKNGIAEFRTTNPAYLKASWVCLKFMRYFETVPFELGFEAQTHREGRVQLGGLTTPVDGCEVQEAYGHVWPDPRGYHSAVEIAFDARARHFFADRAAARELALYLRWSEHHLHAPTTGITIARHGSETTYSVRSTTGKVFSVTKRGEQIVSQNVKPYAGPL